MPDVCTDFDMLGSNRILYSQLGLATIPASDKSFTKDSKRLTFSEDADGFDKFVMYVSVSDLIDKF